MTDIMTKQILDEQIVPIKTQHLGPVSNWREELANGGELRLEYQLDGEAKLDDRLVSVSFFVPATKNENGDILGTGLESGTLPIPKMDTVRRIGAIPAITADGEVQIVDGYPVVAEKIEGVNIPHEAVTRFVPIHGGMGLKISGGTLKPKFIPNDDPQAPKQPVHRGVQNGGLQCFYLNDVVDEEHLHHTCHVHGSVRVLAQHQRHQCHMPRMLRVVLAPRLVQVVRAPEHSLRPVNL